MLYYNLSLWILSSSTALLMQKLNFLQPSVLRICKSTVTTGWGEESQTYNKHEKSKNLISLEKQTERRHHQYCCYIKQVQFARQLHLSPASF